MPREVKIEDIPAQPNPLPNKFVAGKFLEFDLRDNGKYPILDGYPLPLVIYHSGEGSTIYADYPTNNVMKPELVFMLNEGIDHRDILYVMASFIEFSGMAVKFLDYLESNNIFLPAEKAYHHSYKANNFFIAIAALGNVEITNRLFEHAMTDFESKLDASLAPQVIAEKKKKFVEKMFAKVTNSDNMSIVEYLIRVLSPITLASCGLIEDDNQDDLLRNLAMDPSTMLDKKADSIFVEYDLPLEMITWVKEKADEFGVDVDVVSKAWPKYKVFAFIKELAGAKDSSLVQMWLDNLINPFAQKDFNVDDVKVECSLDDKGALECYTLSGFVLESVHYAGELVPTKIEMRSEPMLDLLSNIGYLAKAVDPELQARLRRHSDTMKVQGAQLEQTAAQTAQNTREIKEIKIDVMDLKASVTQISKVVKEYVADESVLKNLDTPALKQAYVSLRNELLSKLKSLLKGDVQLKLCSNLEFAANVADIAVSISGAPGVIGIATTILVCAAKHVAVMQAKKQSKDLTKVLDAYNMPLLLSVAVAEAITIRARDNGFNLLKDSEQAGFNKAVKKVILAQLSGSEFRKLMDSILQASGASSKFSPFEAFRDSLITAAEIGRPITLSFDNPRKASFLPFSSNATSAVLSIELDRDSIELCKKLLGSARLKAASAGSDSENTLTLDKRSSSSMSSKPSS